jgi:conjugative relaxase-like TrwC/TraI family protein
VLSIGKLLPGRADYYLGTVANGVEDYYTGAGEAPGQWIGLGTKQLGLEGQVDGDQLHRVLEFEHPVTGERLTRGHAVAKVVGFDTTFCAPKSVSLLFGLGAPEVSNEVRNAHDAAVARSFAVFESVAQGRRGAGGHRVVAGDGFVGAAFRHRTSRNLDPHLHTHVVVANLVHAVEDDRWSALDARPLYQWCRTVGHLYQAELRHELTRRLGVEWQPIRDGLADVAGFPDTVITAFSTRRAEIEADLSGHGMSGAKAAQAAVYMTRAAKQLDVSTAELVGRWRAQAAELGLDGPALAAMLDRVAVSDVPVSGTPDADRLFARLAGPGGLTERTSSFDRRDVIEAICDALPAGGRTEAILELADGFLNSDHVVRLGDQADAALRRKDGMILPAGVEVERFSTPEMIAIEQQLLACAARRQDAGSGLARPEGLEAALAARPTVSDEQAAMVRQLCRSGAGVDLVEGVAGAGKTFALAAARDAWTASGLSVSGVCLAAKTARRLQDDTAIASSTLDALLLRVEAGARLSDVVVVDEAAMVGTRKLARLLAHAEHEGTKVVLIGDPRQLPEIDAGGAFSGLAKRLGAVELTDNRRQHEPWERAALAQLRHGDPDQAIDELLDHDRVHIAERAEDLHEQMIERWWNAHRDGGRVLLIAPTNVQVDQLNRHARGLLRAAGELYGPDHRIGDRAFAVGDRVLGLRNDRAIGILNGDDATVARIDPARRQLTVLADSGPVVVPYSYAERWFTHGYATTVHKAQGANVDRTLVLTDDTVSRPHLYTALSRGRISNDLFITARDWRAEFSHAPELEPDPLGALRLAARREPDRQLAIDSDDRFVPTEALRAEEHRLWKLLMTGPRDPSRELRQITKQLGDERAVLADARTRYARTEVDLDALGPLGRRLHPKQRTRLENQLDDDRRLIDTTTDKIATFSQMANGLAGDARRHRAWTIQHAPERQRLEEVRATLAARALVEPPGAEQGIDTGLQAQGLGRDDIGLGL